MLGFVKEQGETQSKEAVQSARQAKVTTTISGRDDGKREQGEDSGPLNRHRFFTVKAKQMHCLALKLRFSSLKKVLQM